MESRPAIVITPTTINVRALLFMDHNQWPSVGYTLEIHFTNHPVSASLAFFQGRLRVNPAAAGQAPAQDAPQQDPGPDTLQQSTGSHDSAQVERPLGLRGRQGSRPGPGTGQPAASTLLKVEPRSRPFPGSAVQTVRAPGQQEEGQWRATAAPQPWPHSPVYQGGQRRLGSGANTAGLR